MRRAEQDRDNTSGHHLVSNLNGRSFVTSANTAHSKRYPVFDETTIHLLVRDAKKSGLLQYAHRFCLGYTRLHVFNPGFDLEILKQNSGLCRVGPLNESRFERCKIATKSRARIRFCEIPQEYLLHL